CIGRVSVPSSSGHSLQHTTIPIPTARTRVSVPSSSGHSLQRCERMPPRDQAHVSVPSSSGHSLQRAPRRCKQTGLCCFSPLFIGALSSTGGSPHGLPADHSFSPLFIGALSSTLVGGEVIQFET